MTKLLLHLFVKDYRDINNPAVHSAIGKLAGFTGIVCNILLFIGKLVVGLVIGSISIIADAVNNLSDASSSLVMLVGFQLAQKPADKDHPYGHARFEYLSGLVVSAMILFIGAELVKSSVIKIINPVPVEFSIITFAILLISICIKLWMSLFYASLGKYIHSITLQATSLDSRNDVVATTAVLVGGLIAHFFSLNIDGYVGLAVALFILYSGVKIARETISPLLGKQADAELVENISKEVLSNDKVLGIHDLLVHDYGPGQYFASVHVELSAEDDPLICHDIIDDIECDVFKKLNVHLVIHYDPVLVNDSEWNELKHCVETIINKISPELSMHDFRMVRGANQTKLVFDVAVPYFMSFQCQDIKQRIDDFLLAEGKHYITVIRFDEK